MINGIGIHIKVKDFQKSLRFYESLGFKKVFEYGSDKEVKEDYNGTVFAHGGCKLEIADGHRAVKPQVFGETISSPKISLMINVDSISEIVEKCTQNNIPVVVEPRHYYWGTIEVVVKDPDGVVLVFVTPYSEKEANKVKADDSFSTLP